MPIQVQIPGPLRSLTGGRGTLDVEANDIGALIDALEAAYPGFQARLVDAGGELRSYVRCFVNGDDVRTTGGKATPLKDGDKVAIVPAIAGGWEDEVGSVFGDF